MQPSLKSSSPPYRPDIDGLRAVAVLMVVGFHAFPEHFPGGFIGVDVFFVISGYLISLILYRSLERGTFSFLVFYAHRIRRLFPALLTVLTACLAFGWFALFADEYRSLGKHAAGGAAFISNFLLWQESGYFDQEAVTKPLLHLWSLGVEEQFYLLWPLLVWLAWKMRLSLPVITLGIIVLSWGGSLALAPVDPVANFYLPLTRLWELLAGGALAWAALYSKQRTVSSLTRTLLAGTGLALILFGVVCINPRLEEYFGTLLIIPVLGTTLIIAAGERAWPNRLLLSHPLAVGLGLVSYPLYLWHWPLLSFAHIVESETPDARIRLACLFIALVLAWLTYRWVEMPARRAPLKTSVTALSLLMVTVGGMGYAVYAREGFASRLPVPYGHKPAAQHIDDACLRYTGQNPSPFTYCRLSDAGGKATVAVIGDSHAYAAFPGMADFLKDRSVNTLLLANSLCLPFMRTDASLDTEARDCNQRTQALLRLIMSKSDITDVFIVTRGPFYLTGLNLREAREGAHGKPRISAEAFKQSLQEMVSALAAIGKRVYYVEENPELLKSPTACLPRPFRLQPEKCEIAVQVIHERNAPYRAQLATLKNVQVVYTVEPFCPEGICRPFSPEGVLLYRDRNHLSEAGSVFQADTVLRPYLLAIAQRSP